MPAHLALAEHGPYREVVIPGVDGMPALAEEFPDHVFHEEGDESLDVWGEDAHPGDRIWISASGIPATDYVAYHVVDRECADSACGQIVGRGIFHSRFSAWSRGELRGVYFGEQYGRDIFVPFGWWLLVSRIGDMYAFPSLDEAVRVGFLLLDSQEES